MATPTNVETDDIDTQKSQASQKGDHAGVAFVVGIDGEDMERPRATPPKRFIEYHKKTVSRQVLEQKQLEAEYRRKELEREMLRRVQQARDDVTKLNKNVNALLEQDAKQRGSQGTNEIPSMAPHQLKAKFRAVNKDYIKMTSSIISSARLPSQ
ncbi:hypothetical protein V1264_021974 [Littorina saxatilis]|uniref:Uncharacterized protein n=1 Tax=Littorina saxatilis TaxID=31220 RepID=A0AAN9FWQ9_9CAEN